MPGPTPRRSRPRPGPPASWAAPSPRWRRGCPRASRRPVPRLGEEGDGATSHHDGFASLEPPCPLGAFDFYHSGSCQPPVAADEADALRLEPFEVTGVVPVVRHVIALGERGLDVDRAGDG